MASPDEPPAWHRSRACTGGPACVEIAPLSDGGMMMRDSKADDGPVLSFSSERWNEFVGAVHAGEFGSATGRR